LRLKIPSYKLTQIILLNVFLLFFVTESRVYAGNLDSIRQEVRLHSHLLIDPEEFRVELIDSLLTEQIPLAFLTSDEITGKLKSLLPSLSKSDFPVILVSDSVNFTGTENNSNLFVVSGNDLEKVNISENPIATLSCKEFLWVEFDADSLLMVDSFIKVWDQTGKLPNFIRINSQNFRQVSSIISLLNKQPKIFGVVKNGTQLLADVSWKDIPNRKTNGYFSFPVGSFTTIALSPYKPGYQFSPDIILPSPENLQNLKIFNAVTLAPEFGLTDRFAFLKKVRNLKRNNDEEIILYGVELRNEKDFGNCAYFSGKAYLDGGLQSRTALKPNFSITAWIKPTELGPNNCILAKGKDFVLKIHNGLLTFTVQGIKDYHSSNTRIPLNQWSFIGLVHNEFDNQVSFFLNGELTETISLLTPYSESDFTMLIGSNLWEEYFVGYMGEIKIWNRELNESEIRNEYLTENNSKRTIFSRWFVWIGLGFGLFGFYLLQQFMRRKHSVKTTNIKPAASKIQKSILPVVYSEAKEQIHCFGGLKVISNDGKDVSLKFSPKIKQLFVLIFLHSFGEQKGISSKKLSDYLWPGMSPQNAKNIRGTNIQNLKALLAPCSGVKLVFQDKLWMLEFTENYYVDYVSVDSMLSQLETMEEIVTLVSRLPELLLVLKKGAFLPNMSETWVDPYIDRMSNRIIEFGQKLFLQLTNEKYDSVLLDVAEVISINDPLNEPALRKKITILTRQGKLSFAHSVFDSFVKLYFELYQEKYSSDFKSLISIGNLTSEA